MKRCLLKLCSMVLICVMLLNLLCSVNNVYAAENVALLYGDTNRDNAINAKDALEVLKFAAKGLEDFPVIDGELTWKVGDVNADHSINAKDALDILKYSAKIINVFSIEMKLIEFNTEDIRSIVLENIENEVVLGDYKGIEVELEKLVVTDEDIQYYIDMALELAGLSELTDEFVVSMEIEGVTTVEEFKAYLKAVVEEQMEEAQEYYELDAVFREILADSEILAYNDPALNVDEMCDEIIAATKDTAEIMGISYEAYVTTYMEMSVEDFEAELRLEYEFYVDSILLMRAIAKAENIEVSQKEFEAAYAEQIADYELLGYESVEEYAKAVYEELLYTKVQDMVMESAMVSYK